MLVSWLVGVGWMVLVAWGWWLWLVVGCLFVGVGWCWLVLVFVCVGVGWLVLVGWCWLIVVGLWLVGW